MDVRIANREDVIRLLHQKQSDLGLCCLSGLFWQVTIVWSFRTFTVWLIFFQEGDSVSQARLHFSDPDSTSIGDSSQGNVNFGNPLYQMNDDDL